MNMWDNEPNLEAWEYANLQCAIVRQKHSGHLCGYVGIPQNHPWYGKNFNDKVSCPDIEGRKVNIDKMGAIPCFCASIYCDFDNKLLAICLMLEAHGGITYSGSSPNYPVPNDNLWWFGFDCSHDEDLQPKLSYSTGTYRDFQYVKEETNKLAEQLAAVAEQQDEVV